MKWLNKLCRSLIDEQRANGISMFGSSLFRIADNFQSGTCNMQRYVGNKHFSFGRSNMSLLFRHISARSLCEQQDYTERPSFRSINPSTSCRRFGQSAQREPCLTRSWSVQLWAAEKEKRNYRRKKKQGIRRRVEREDSIVQALSSFRLPLLGSFLRKLSLDEQETLVNTTTAKQPSINQFGEGFLTPGSPEEVKLAPLLSRPNLLITRDIEWANIMFAFEQESRYVVVDPNNPRPPAGFISEQSNVIFRQLLRTRRPFIAYITDARNNEIFRVRRPFWLINSTIYAEVGDKVVGVVHRRWHLWKRIYDLYLGNKQFAVVENPGFWNWTFTLKDDEENVLAQIDRDWRGFGLELFTDAGQYVIRFGDADTSSKYGLDSMIQELEVVRPLTLAERAVTVALAVSLDTDYFSRSGGWGLPIIIAGE